MGFWLGTRTWHVIRQIRRVLTGFLLSRSQFFCVAVGTTRSSILHHRIVCAIPSLKALICKMVYIRQKDLPQLHNYKYASVDRSLVSRYVLKPFYSNVVIHCFPMSMA